MLDDVPLFLVRPVQHRHKVPLRHLLRRRVHVEPQERRQPALRPRQQRPKRLGHSDHLEAGQADDATARDRRVLNDVYIRVLNDVLNDVSPPVQNVNAKIAM